MTEPNKHERQAALDFLLPNWKRTKDRSKHLQYVRSGAVHKGLPERTPVLAQAFAERRVQAIQESPLFEAAQEAYASLRFVVSASVAQHITVYQRDLIDNIGIEIRALLGIKES